MRPWLLVSFVLQAAAGTAAYSQNNGFASAHFATPVSTHSADFSLHDSSWVNDPAPFDGGMITREDAATDTIVGLGLVKMRGRTRSGSDTDVDVQKRNPAVTVVLKF